MIVLIPLLHRNCGCSTEVQEVKVNIGDRVVVKFEGADFHGEVTVFFNMTSGEIKMNVD